MEDFEGGCNPPCITWGPNEALREHKALVPGGTDA